MSKYSSEIWILITRKLSGELSRAEEERFQQWLKADSENEEFFRSLERSWTDEPEHAADKFFFDYSKGLNRLRDKIEKDTPAAPVHTTIKKRKKFSEYQRWVIAAGVLIAVTLSVAGSFLLGNIFQEKEITRRSYVTSDVEQRIITLADGSVVRLNRNSEIELKNEISDTREVWLQGEAFFDIESDPARPFIIYTGDAVVEVLGTSFNVKGREEVLVAVKEGMVSLRNSSHAERSAAQLSAGQLGVLSKGGEDVKIETDEVENYFSWMNGHIKFERMPFDKVIQQLERIYDEEHRLEDAEMRSIRLTVYTEQIQRERVLESISQALNVSYTDQDGVVVWQRER